MPWGNGAFCAFRENRSLLPSLNTACAAEPLSAVSCRSFSSCPQRQPLLHYGKQGCGSPVLELLQDTTELGRCAAGKASAGPLQQAASEKGFSLPCSQAIDALQSVFFHLVWDRRYHSNLKSNLTARALRAAEQRFKGYGGRAPVACHLEGSIKKITIKIHQPPLSSCRHSHKKMHTKPPRRGKCLHWRACLQPKKYA